MERVFLDEFEGKKDVTKIIYDNGTVSYLTKARTFDEETSAKGATKLNIAEKKPVLLLFNSEDKVVGKYYIGKALQGKAPSELLELKDNLAFLDSFYLEKKQWIPFVGTLAKDQLKDLASKAVSFNVTSKKEDTNEVKQCQDNNKSKNHELVEEERIERIKNNIIKPKFTVVDDYRRQHESQFLDLVNQTNSKDSFKKHALSIMMLRPGIEFLYYASNELKPLWMYNGRLYCDQNNSVYGASAFIWIMQHYKQQEDFCYLLDLLDVQISHRWLESLKEPEELINEIKRNIPSFKLGNNPQSVKNSLGWAWIDLQAILHFIDYCTKNLNDIPERNIHNLQECSSLEDLANIFLYDMHIIRNNGNQDSSNNQDVELPF